MYTTYHYCALHVDSLLVYFPWKNHVHPSSHIWNTAHSCEQFPVLFSNWFNPRKCGIPESWVVLTTLNSSIQWFTMEPPGIFNPKIRSTKAVWHILTLKSLAFLHESFLGLRSESAPKANGRRSAEKGAPHLERVISVSLHDWQDWHHFGCGFASR